MQSFKIVALLFLGLIGWDQGLYSGPDLRDTVPNSGHLYYLSRKCPDFKLSFNILRVRPDELIGTVFFVTEIVKNLYVRLQYGAHDDFT